MDVSELSRAQRVARVVMWVQAAANLAFGVLVLVEVFDRFDHGREVDGAYYLQIVLNLLVAGGLAASALWLRRSWARPLGMVAEGVIILSGMVVLIQGALVGAVTIAVAVAVIVMLSQQPATTRL